MALFFLYVCRFVKIYGKIFLPELRQTQGFFGSVFLLFVFFKKDKKHTGSNSVKGDDLNEMLPI